MDYEVGQTIQYRLFDKKGKAYWLDGTIHGIRRYEDPKTNAIINQTYLVDTGRDTKIDQHPVNRRHKEIDRRAAKLVAKGEEPVAAYAEVYKHSDLPADKIDVEVVRQPEQLELPAEHIRTA